MRRVTIRVVSEGPTDQLVIKELVNAYLATQPQVDFDLDLIDEQPTSDRTSRTGSTEGGWEMVYKWCLSNPPHEREARFFGNGLFANNMDTVSCDALLINMDSDICEKISDKTDVFPVPSIDATSIERGAFIKSVIESWLFPNQAPVDKKHIIAPAVEAIEAWLVAGLSDADHDPESNHDIQKRLAELDHIVVKNIPPPKTVKRPKKTKSNYIKILNIATQNVQRIADRCPHFKAMIDEIFHTVKPA
ncbi:MAG: hypothetical protein PHP85_12155 [Gallionella sp.]|nr:hypothetical protein [Gallionella sp.]